MAVYAVLNEDGQVVNLVEWDGIAEWRPPDGHTVREAIPEDHEAHTAYHTQETPTGDERVPGDDDAAGTVGW